MGKETFSRREFIKGAVGLISAAELMSACGQEWQRITSPNFPYQMDYPKGWATYIMQMGPSEDRKLDIFTPNLQSIPLEVEITMDHKVKEANIDLDKIAESSIRESLREWQAMGVSGYTFNILGPNDQDTEGLNRVASKYPAYHIHILFPGSDASHQDEVIFTTNQDIWYAILTVRPSERTKFIPIFRKMLDSFSPLN